MENAYVKMVTMMILKIVYARNVIIAGRIIFFFNL